MKKIFTFLGIDIFKYSTSCEIVSIKGDVQYFDVEWLWHVPDYTKQFECVVMHNNGTFSLYTVDGVEGPENILLTAIQPIAQTIHNATATIKGAK